jgi:hypothetical protein
MVSLEKCYEILNQNTQNYTMEEAKEIRKTLYQMAEIIYESKLTNDEIPQREKSNSIQKS